MDSHPVIMTIRDNKDYIRALLYSNYTTITGWGGPRVGREKCCEIDPDI